MSNLDLTNSQDFSIWDKDFLEKTDSIINLPALNSLEVEIILKELEEKSKTSNFEELVDICYSIVQRVPIPLVKIDVNYIVRCRPNDPGQIFKQSSELSYNPNQDKISQGRFNLIKEPIFYAVLPSNSKNNYPPELATIFETCKDLKTILTIAKEKLVTLSYWKIAKEFFAISLSFYDEAKNKNDNIHNINTFFETILKNRFTDTSKEPLLKLYRFLSQKASHVKEDDSDYLITTAFKHALTKFYGKKINAIIYSGADSENHCINIALSKDLVDEKYIDFLGAIMYKIKLDKQIIPYTEIAYPMQGKYFIFQPVKNLPTS